MWLWISWGIVETCWIPRWCRTKSHWGCFWCHFRDCLNIFSGCRSFNWWNREFPKKKSNITAQRLLAFGGNRIWNLAIKTTDGATIFTYLGKSDKFKLINKWENSTMKNEVEVRGIDWSSEWNYTIKFWCVMIFFWSKMQNCFEKKGKKKLRPLQRDLWSSVGIGHMD